MKAVDPYSDHLEPLFDVVPVFVVKMTAQFVANNDSQIAASIDEKLCLGDIVVFGGTIEKRRPQNLSRSDGLHESRALVNAAGSVPWRL